MILTLFYIAVSSNRAVLEGSKNIEGLEQSNKAASGF